MSATKVKPDGATSGGLIAPRPLSPRELEIIAWLEEPQTAQVRPNVITLDRTTLKMHAEYATMFRNARPNEAPLLTSEEIPLLP